MVPSDLDGRNALGRRAEDVAAQLYVGKGYTILDRNWSCRGGEIDLVVARDGVVAFVEVRSVSTDFLAGAEVSVTPAKQARVCIAADLWLGRSDTDYGDIRFDVVAVRFRTLRSPLVECFEDAFVPAWGV